MSQGDHLQCIKQTIQKIRTELGGALADAVTPILYVNNQRCRIQKYQGINPTGTVQEYVFHVGRKAENTVGDCGYVHVLLLAGSLNRRLKLVSMNTENIIGFPCLSQVRFRC